MPVALHCLTECQISKLSNALSKLRLNTIGEHKGRRKSPTPNAQVKSWNVPAPNGLTETRARDYTRSISFTLDGKPFLPQCSEIIPNRLFISDYYTGTEASVLSKLRITHVVSIVKTSTKISRSRKGVQCHETVIPDPYNEDSLLGKIDNAIGFIDDALREDDSRLLVYCNGNVDWSACIAIGWIMRNENCSYEVAKKTVKRKRPVINPGLEMERVVMEWWTFELMRQLFPPGRGGRARDQKTEVLQLTTEVDGLSEDSYEDVIDIK